MEPARGTPRVLVLGSTSLVGSHFAVYWGGGALRAAGRQDPRERRYPIESFVRLDLGDEEGVRSLLRSTDADCILNFTARTDVDGCEKERPTAADAPARPDRGSAWTLNAQLPRWIAEEAAERGMFVVHLSTDFVFDGGAGPYAEEDTPSKLNSKVSWYGYTKGVGEGPIRALIPKGQGALLRLSYAYRGDFEWKVDMARSLLVRLANGTLHPLYTDQEITPTWIPDVTDALSAILAARKAGIFHVASPVPTTPYEFAEVLFTESGVGTESLRRGQLVGTTQPGRAPRPIHGGLQVRNILRLGVRPTDFREGIRKLVEELHATRRRGASPVARP